MIVFIVIPKNSGLQEYTKIALARLEATKNAATDTATQATTEKNRRTVVVRGEDVPIWIDELSAQGKDAIGLVGEDLYEEFCATTKRRLRIIDRVTWDDPSARYRKPALCLIGPKKGVLQRDIQELTKSIKTIGIASKYVQTAKEYMRRVGIDARIIVLSGCIEPACAEGIADAIIDIVYSGRSMEENGLEVYDVISTSDFLIIGNVKEIRNKDNASGAQ